MLLSYSDRTVCRYPFSFSSHLNGLDFPTQRATELSLHALTDGSDLSTCQISPYQQMYNLTDNHLYPTPHCLNLLHHPPYFYSFSILLFLPLLPHHSLILDCLPPCFSLCLSLCLCVCGLSLSARSLANLVTLELRENLLKSLPT